MNLNASNRLERMLRDFKKILFKRLRDPCLTESSSAQVAGISSTN